MYVGKWAYPYTLTHTNLPLLIQTSDVVYCWHGLPNAIQNHTQTIHSTHARRYIFRYTIIFKYIYLHIHIYQNSGTSMIMSIYTNEHANMYESG